MCEPEEREEIVSSIVSLSESIMQKADELRRYDSEESEETDCVQGKLHDRRHDTHDCN